MTIRPDRRFARWIVNSTNAAVSGDYSFEGGDVLNPGDGRVLVSTATSSTNLRGAEWAKRMR